MFYAINAVAAAAVVVVVVVVVVVQSSSPKTTKSARSIITRSLKSSKIAFFEIYTFEAPSLSFTLPILMQAR